MAVKKKYYQSIQIKENVNIFLDQKKWIWNDKIAIKFKENQMNLIGKVTD